MQFHESEKDALKEIVVDDGPASSAGTAEDMEAVAVSGEGSAARSELRVSKADGAATTVRDAGKYKILERIGSGGMGEVYKAVNKETKTVHAVKVIRPDLVADPKMLKRFQQESDAASNLTHANLAAVYERGCTESGAPFLVMDFIEGQSLAELLSKEGNLAPERALSLFIQISEALSHAHRKNVLHRDIKPSNIMLTGQEGELDRVKVLDFGISKVVTARGTDHNKLTQTAQVLGSPTYMSPEQCLGRPLDFRADIYAFGCLMYETLAGKPPFGGDNAIQIIKRQVKEAPPPLPLTGSNARLESDLAKIISSALKKDPGERYQTIDELRFDLLRAQAGKRLKKGSGFDCSSPVFCWGAALSCLPLVVWLVSLSPLPGSLQRLAGAGVPVTPHFSMPVAGAWRFRGHPMPQGAVDAFYAVDPAPAPAPIEIKNIQGVTLYIAKNARSMREALKEAIEKKVNLQGVDLKGENLGYESEGGLGRRGLDFTDMNLSHADFTGSDLTMSRFVHCDLTGANFEGACLKHGDIGQTDMMQAPVGRDDKVRRLRKSMSSGGRTEYLSEPFAGSFSVPFDYRFAGGEFCHGIPAVAVFQGCKLGGANLAGSDMTLCSVVTSDLRGANLRGVSAMHAAFDGCDLQTADLYKAKFAQALFYSCSLSDANAMGTDFEKAQFKNTALGQIKLDQHTNFQSASLIGDYRIEDKNGTIHFKP